MALHPDYDPNLRLVLAESPLNSALKAELDSPLTSAQIRLVQEMFLTDLDMFRSDGNQAVVTTLRHQVTTALLLATISNLNPDTKKGIIAGTLLHDTGKFGIPGLQYNRPLSPDEYERMKLHPILGRKKMEASGLPQIVIDMAAFHHEKPDGTGYPYGLSSPEIPISALLLQMGDEIEASTASFAFRPYNSGGKPLHKTVTQIRNRFSVNGLKGTLMQPLSEIFARFANPDNLVLARQLSVEIVEGWLDRRFTPESDNLIDQANYAASILSIK